MNRLLSSVALCRQQIVVLLLMTCFALAMTAPTTPPTSILKKEAFEKSSDTENIERPIRGEAEKPLNEMLPVPMMTISSDAVTSANYDDDDNEMMKTRLTTNGNLIGTKSQPEAATTEYDNGTIKIHESVESTTESALLEANINKSIKTVDDFTGAQSVATTIEMPINVENFEEKKGKSKKKALKALDKKQKLKLKDINFVASNEPPTAASEVYETTTHETTTISTSIKTAPTTIKSTTLTTIKSFQLESAATKPMLTTDSALNFNEIETTTMFASQQQHYSGNNDNVIVLNSNSSGLIVVDIMENFGNASTNATETFEIKMDLIDDATTTPASSTENDKNLKRDDIFLTTVETLSTLKIDSGTMKTTATSDDDIILINVNTESTVTTESSSSKQIKWNQLKSDEGNGNIKITFDNIDLPNQNVNVSIENGELVIDSIDISVLNKAEEELRKKKVSNGGGERERLNKTDSLEIILIEDDSRQEEKEINRDNLGENDENNLTTQVNDSEATSTTIHFDKSSGNDRLKKIELGVGRSEEDEEDGIKIKTTDKDSDTIFYISNTEVKVIESIPTASPNASQDKKYFPAIYEEDVIVDIPNKSRASGTIMSDKYEEDIVLSPLTSDFDPKDINYIGEAFLDVEESSNSVGISGNHIIPLTSDVVIQPVQLRDSPNVGIPIIGELPPQIELEEMVFSDDYDSKQQTNFRVEEYYPNFLSNRLVKNQLEADVPKELIFDSKNLTLLPNRTHISVNTMINGTNMTSPSSTFQNATALLLENDDNESSDLYDIQTLLLACFATLVLLFLCVIIALTIRCCWRKYHRQDSSGNDMMSDKSTDPLAGKNAAYSTDELKSTESGMTLDRGGNMQASTELLLAANGDITPTNHNGTNGSIITMTLKNNHLIVETEERNDISRDTRETKMHYSPSEKDGVFIVESARGADQNGSHKPSPLQQKSTEAPLVIPEEIKIDTLQSHFTPSSPEEEQKQPKPEQVEVHTPPAEHDGDRKVPEAVTCNGTKTGLSQSDLSLTSSNSSNQNYSYGDKDTYQFEEKGYKGSSPKRIINIHCHDLKPLIENSPPAPIGDHNKPVITSAIFKNDSHENGETLKSDAQATQGNDVIPPPKDENLDKAKIHKINGIIKNGLDEIISVPDENCNDAIIYTNGCNGELNMDSLSFLPAPPEELSNDHTILELTSLDSLPPPPPEMTGVGQS